MRQGLDHLEDRVSRINEISDSILERNLRQMSSTILVNLPVDQSFTLSRFVNLQDESIRKGSALLNAKSKEMETVLCELLQENRSLANSTHVHSKSDMLQEVMIYF